MFVMKCRGGASLRLMRFRSKGLHGSRFQGRGSLADGIAQRRAELGQADLEDVARDGLDLIGERQGRGAEEVDMHIARAQGIAGT